MTELLHVALLALALTVALSCSLFLARGLRSAEPPSTFVYQDRPCHWSLGRVSCE